MLRSLVAPTHPVSSNAIIQHGRKLYRDGKTIDIEEPWPESGAYHLYFSQAADQYGVFVPRWLSISVRNPGLAMVLSRVLYWFDDADNASGKRANAPERVHKVSVHDGSWCRARGRAEDGRRCLVTTYSKFAWEIGLERRSVMHSLGVLSEKKYLDVLDGGKTYPGTLLIIPKPRQFAKAYYEYTGDSVAFKEFLSKKPFFDAWAGAWDAEHNFGPEGFDWDLFWKEVALLRRSGAKWELKHLQYRPGWYESQTRRRAMARDPERRYWRAWTNTSSTPWKRNRSQVEAPPTCVGTFVPAMALAACEGRPGPALLLSQTLWNFTPKMDGSVRIPLLRDGRLWFYASKRFWEHNLGIPGADAERCIEFLRERKLLVVERRKWCVDHRRDRGRPTTHLRPDVEGIDRAVNSDKAQDRYDRIELANMFYDKSIEDSKIEAAMGVAERTGNKKSRRKGSPTE